MSWRNWYDAAVDYGIWIKDGCYSFVSTSVRTSDTRSVRMTEGVFGNLTGDPYSWAEEWLKVYSILYPDGVEIDKEWMMGWFANAIVRGESEYAKADDYLRQTIGPDWRITIDRWWEDEYLTPHNKDKE